MTELKLASRTPALLALFALWSCSTDLTEPAAHRAPDPRLLMARQQPLRNSTANPALESTNLTFYVVQGRSARGSINFVSERGAGPSNEPFLTFRTSPRTQLVRPDGSFVASGDSVAITITVPDSREVGARFEPSGLRFLGEPAALTMSIEKVSADLDGNGRVDAADALLSARIAIWKQEHDGEPFVALPSVRSSARRVTALIDGFTNYITAY
jgi:hypothetical protein